MTDPTTPAQVDIEELQEALTRAEKFPILHMSIRVASLRALIAEVRAHRLRRRALTCGPSDVQNRAMSLLQELGHGEFDEVTQSDVIDDAEIATVAEALELYAEKHRELPAPPAVKEPTP